MKSKVQDRHTQATLSLEDLIAELARARTASQADGFVPAIELSRQAGRGKEWVRSRLARLHAEGRLEVRLMPAQRIDGQKTLVPAYRLKGAK